MTIKLYMDEQVPRQITLGLRLRNTDVLTVQEDSRSGLDDPKVLARAGELQRVLFTRDDDFLTIASEYLESGTPFGGIIYAHQKLASIGDCVRDLELIATACDLSDFNNHVEYLPL
jgi:predicted nuclease of predicted toxin-antitoxin system